MKRVNTGAAVELQNPIPPAENAVKLLPDDFALRPADQGIRESLVVRIGHWIKGYLREKPGTLFENTHASTSLAEILNPS
jgi:hypothetical protein